MNLVWHIVKKDFARYRWAIALWGAFLYWWAGILYLKETGRVVRGTPVPAGAASDTLSGEEVDGG